MRSKYLIYTIFLSLLILGQIGFSFEKKAKIDSIISIMTLEEKIGQLNQYSYGGLTGPAGEPINPIEEVRKGRVGSFLNLTGVKNIKEIQRIAVEESRLGLPLLFALDVVHGYKTIFPMPLAEAASWDLHLIEKSARISAVEASAAGIHWTFAPMVDVARDPRWGRIMEGAGEDPYLASLIAAARVKGFQGENLSDNNTILASAKHFAGYGAVQAGRDYYTTDMSLTTLHEIYLPPFKAAVDAGVSTFMSAFNDLNGIPCSGNRYLLQDVLRQNWNFSGFVVSDWTSIKEMINHGYAKDRKTAAEIAINAGIDMDMMSAVYIEHLANLINQGLVKESRMNDAVYHILAAKYELGLLEDPYRYCDEERENALILSPAHLQFAREIAQKSIVLLKNQNHILPLKKSIKTVAVVGPLAKEKDAPLGFAAALGEAESTVSLLEGIQNKLSEKNQILYAKGCNVNDDSQFIKEAVDIAKRAEVVIIAVGESRDMSGESKSRGNIGLPGIQLDLVKAIQKTEKPVIVVLMNGRPLAIPWISENCDAILETWLLGTQSGNAIAEVIFGDYNPSAKLPVTFPAHVGQIPIFYNHKNSGRPPSETDSWTSKYIDIPHEPLYPFGYGQSYTSFEYSEISLSANQINQKDSLRISTTVQNTGTYSGIETVQLYLRDDFASITRPVKELKRFQKIELQPGEIKEVNFTLGTSDLGFYNQKLEFVVEPGEFAIFVGGNSRDVKQAQFTLLE